MSALQQLRVSLPQPPFLRTASDTPTSREDHADCFRIHVPDFRAVKVACAYLCVPSNGEMILKTEDRSTRRKTCPSSSHTSRQQLIELSTRDESTATNRLSHGTYSKAQNSPKPAVPNMCSADSMGSETSSQGIRDQFPRDPWVQFCNAYFKVNFF